MSFFAELKRRNVFKVGIAYALMGWVLLQAADFALDLIEAPNWVIQTLVVVIIIGLPFALLFAWAFELTPEGIKRDHEIDRTQSITPQTGRKLDYLIIGFLMLVIALMGVERVLFVEMGSEKGSEPFISNADPVSGKGTAEKGSDPIKSEKGSDPIESVAVLPFRSMSAGEDDEFFADGLTEEILNSLTALPELLVTARTSSFHFKGKDLPVPEIAATLGVDHVVEGSVRRAGDTVRITAQLVRAEDGFHLWSQTYDRTLEDVFKVQEDIAASIAETLDVVLDASKLELMRKAGIGDVEAFIAFQKGYDAFMHAHTLSDPIEGLPAANHWFDQALAKVPDIDDALFLRTDLYGHLLLHYAGLVSDLPASEAEAAVGQIRESLDRASRAAGNESLKAILASERQLFSDDWTGIQSRLDLALTTGHCNRLNWISALASPWGRAAGVVELQQERMRCDPMAALPVAVAARALIWDGRALQGLELTEKYLAERGFDPWLDDMRFTALMASGSYQDEPDFFGPTPEGSIYRFERGLFAHALTGNTARARALYDAGMVDGALAADTTIRIVALAAMGDREGVNALASQVDERTGSQLLLSLATELCFCGAPFDLEATPRYRARLSEAGFAWPPPTIINYPTKDW